MHAPQESARLLQDVFGTVMVNKDEYIINAAFILLQHFFYFIARKTKHLYNSLYILIYSVRKYKRLLYVKFTLRLFEIILLFSV